MAGPRVLLANEFGAGRGHLVTLTRLAQAFGPGFVFDAALCSRRHEDVLAPLQATVFNGPWLGYRSDRRLGHDAVPTATWGEYLGDLGFDQVNRLREVVAWWRDVLQQRRVNLVLADYAPLALLAARSLNIPCVATGQGYGLPPWDMPAFPLFNAQARVCLHDECQLLANVNTVAREIGLAELRGLPEVYRADLSLVHTIPMLDPYACWRREPYLPPVTDIGLALAGGGDEVFVYFSTSEFQHPDLVQVLASLPLPRRGYCPALPPQLADRLTQSGMVLESEPVPVDDIARRSRLLLNAGQHGILSLGLFSGLAQVCLPQHSEQRHHAACAERAGVAAVVRNGAQLGTELQDAVMRAYHQSDIHEAAYLLAKSLRQSLPAPPEQQLSQRIAPLRDVLLQRQH